MMSEKIHLSNSDDDHEIKQSKQATSKKRKAIGDGVGSTRKRKATVNESGRALKNEFVTPHTYTHQHYTLGAVLGKGSYGTVFKAKRRGSMEVFAVKRVTCGYSIAQEFNLLSVNEDHPNIVQCEHVFKADNGDDCMVMEYLPRNLKH